MICLRVVSGISCGAVSPALQSLLGQWVPVYERSRLTVIVVSGQMVRRDTISKGLNARSFYSQCHLQYKLVIYHKKSINNMKSGQFPSEQIVSFIFYKQGVRKYGKICVTCCINVGTPLAFRHKLWIFIILYECTAAFLQQQQNDKPKTLQLWPDAVLTDKIWENIEANIENATHME